MGLYITAIEKDHEKKYTFTTWQQYLCMIDKLSQLFF